MPGRHGQAQQPHPKKHRVCETKPWSRLIQKTSLISRPFTSFWPWHNKLCGKNSVWVPSGSRWACTSTGLASKKSLKATVTDLEDETNRLVFSSMPRPVPEASPGALALKKTPSYETPKFVLLTQVHTSKSTSERSKVASWKPTLQRFFSFFHVFFLLPSSTILVGPTCDSAENPAIVLGEASRRTLETGPGRFYQTRGTRGPDGSTYCVVCPCSLFVLLLDVEICRYCRSCNS